jgi:hypothetical protein
MDRNLTNKVIEAGATDIAMTAMRKRRHSILDRIEQAEEAGKPLPANELKQLLGELFDLNIAIGDVPFDDKDEAQ